MCSLKIWVLLIVTFIVFIVITKIITVIINGEK